MEVNLSYDTKDKKFIPKYDTNVTVKTDNKVILRVKEHAVRFVVDGVEQKMDFNESKAERRIEETSAKYRREEIKRIIALPSEVLCRVEKVKGGCWATGNPDMPEAQVNDKCPIRNACKREENNSICQCNGGQSCGRVKEFWRQKIYKNRN